MRAWKAATGCDIYDGYGQTESINIVASFTGMEIRAGLFRGFFRDDAVTAERSATAVLHRRHGDAGCGLLYLVCRPVGRHHSSASYRISPFEVSALIEHEAVLDRRRRQAGRDPRRDRAYITLAPGFEPSDDLATEIQDFVKRQTTPTNTPRHRIPRRPAEDDIRENPAGGVTGRGG